jgi:hypothetical protein
MSTVSLHGADLPDCGANPELIIGFRIKEVKHEDVSAANASN